MCYGICLRDSRWNRPGSQRTNRDRRWTVSVAVRKMNNFQPQRWSLSDWPLALLLGVNWKLTRFFQSVDNFSQSRCFSCTRKCNVYGRQLSHSRPVEVELESRHISLRHLWLPTNVMSQWLLRNVNRKSQVADRNVSVPMTLINLERQDKRFKFGSSASKAVCIYRRKPPKLESAGTPPFAVWASVTPRNTPSQRVILPNLVVLGQTVRGLLRRSTSKMHMGRGLFLNGHPRPTSRGGVPTFPNFGVSFYLCVHPLSQNYHIWRGNRCWGSACILESATSPIPRGRSSSVPQFWCSFLFMGTCTLCRRTTKFYMVTHVGRCMYLWVS